MQVASALPAEKQVVMDPSSTAAPLIDPGALSKLDVGAAGDFPINDIGDYGQRLLTNKVRLFNVADKMYRGKSKNPYSGEHAQRKAVMMAIAMLVSASSSLNTHAPCCFTPCDQQAHLTACRVEASSWCQS